MKIKAVTVNLGGGGPHAKEYKGKAEQWAKDVREENTNKKTYNLLFVQELLDEAWLDKWKEPSWYVVVGSGPIYKPRSAIIANFPIKSVSYSTSEYHGSYVAVARSEPGAADACFFASVHASPTPLNEGWLERWDACGLLRPEPRTGGYLWDSDLVLESMHSIAAHTPLIIAGDWNEARGWDVDHGGVWGAQFFERVGLAGFVDCTHRKWGTEQPTHKKYQLDHVFASTAVARYVEVDDAPGEMIADHASIGFEISLHDN